MAIEVIGFLTGIAAIGAVGFIAVRREMHKSVTAVYGLSRRSGSPPMASAGR